MPQITLDQHPSQAEIDAEVAKGPVIHDWQIDVIQSSLPTPLDESVITQAIKQHKGNIDAVVSEFLDSQYYSSAPGTPGSLSESGNSSIEREQDSEDEDAFNPSKRQNRQKFSHKIGSEAWREQQRKRPERLPERLLPIPSLEITAPDATNSRHTSPELLAIQKIRDHSDVASIATSEEDTNSEYAASTSSRAHSVALGSTPPRPRIILRTASQKAKLERQRQQTGSQEPTPSEDQYQPLLNKTKLISARDRKTLKKIAQKQQAKERKQGNGQSEKLADSTGNIKKESPHMDKVLSLGTLSMIQI